MATSLITSRWATPLTLLAALVAAAALLAMDEPKPDEEIFADYTTTQPETAP